MRWRSTVAAVALLFCAHASILASAAPAQSHGRKILQSTCTTAPGAARAACFCASVTVLKYYADTANGCTGAMWCYGTGSSYLTCGTGLLFNEAAQTCDWAANVKCPTAPVPSPSPKVSPSPSPKPRSPSPSPRVSPSPSPRASPSPSPPPPPRGTCTTFAAAGGACGSSAGGACCSSGQCCSQYGYCGSSDAHCLTGCQALFGACTGTSPPPSPPPISSPSPSPPFPSPPVVPSPSPPVSCLDTDSRCATWLPSSCIYAGVPQICPCLCSGTPPPSPPTPPPSPPPPGPPPPSTAYTSLGVSYHLYQSVDFPAIPEAGAVAQSLPGSNPGYVIDGLYCTDYMRSNPGIPWAIVGWTATTGIASGLLKCGDRICIRNRRNNVQTAAYVVDQGGKGSPTGFDLDYAGVFKVLDPDNQNYIKGSMDIDWWKCNDGIVTPTPSPPPPPPPSPTPDVTPCVLPDGCTTAFITSAQWDQFFPNRNHPDCEGAATDFYRYSAFVTAARSFPGFASSADAATNKREIAAFLAQISHEVTGGWPAAPGGPNQWGLCFINEGGRTPQTAPYCAATAEYPCAAGKTYRGRGPMQLSWNYNYIQAGRALGFDGLNNPDIVAQDPVIAFKTALWFWMTPQSPKPSCHDVMTGRYTPTATDVAAGRVAGYGLTTNIINGGIECGKGVITAQEADRIAYYKRYAEILGAATDASLDCANQRPFTG